MPSRTIHPEPPGRPFDAHTHADPGSHGAIALRSFHLDEVGGDTWETASFRSLGLHPWKVDPATLDQDLGLLARIAERGGLAALGETGLDRTRGPALEHQVRAMEGHVRLSELSGLPLVVHCVRAGSDLLHLRRKSRASRPWILHGWNGSPEQTAQFLESGCVPSFGAALLREDSPTRTLLASLPIGSFLLETDDAPVEAALVEAEAASVRGTDSVTLRGELRATWARVFGAVPEG